MLIFNTTIFTAICIHKMLLHLCLLIALHIHSNIRITANINTVLITSFSINLSKCVLNRILGYVLKLRLDHINSNCLFQHKPCPILNLRLDDLLGYICIICMYMMTRFFAQTKYIQSGNVRKTKNMKIAIIARLAYHHFIFPLIPKHFVFTFVLLHDHHIERTNGIYLLIIVCYIYRYRSLILYNCKFIILNLKA